MLYGSDLKRFMCAIEDEELTTLCTDLNDFIKDNGISDDTVLSLLELIGYDVLDIANDKITSLEQDIEDLQDELDDKERELDDLDMDNFSLEDDLYQANSRINELEEELESTKRELEIVQQELDEAW